jgi:hypothetical protein
LRKNRGMSRTSPLRRRILAFACLLACVCALAACSTIETTANVAKASASVVGTAVGTTASVAKTTADVGLKTVSTAAVVGSATLSAGSAAISAGAAARTATAATASVAIAGATAVGSAVKWGVEFSRSEDIEFASVRAESANLFVSKEGARIATNGCDESKANEPALLVTNRKGEFTVRTRGDEATRECKVVTINEPTTVQ